MKFKLWFNEVANFAFNNDKVSNQKHAYNLYWGTRAVENVSTEVIIEGLSKRPIRETYGKSQFINEIIWGDNVGSIKVEFSPFGSYRANIRKLHKDLNGSSVWITKEIIPLTDQRYIEKEQQMIEDIFNRVKDVDSENLEKPDKEFNRLEKIVLDISYKLRYNHPKTFMFEGVRKKSDHQYIIKFGLTGMGVEAPGQSRVEEFLIEIGFLPDRGLIKIFGHDVQSPTKGHTWIPQPSEFEEYFMPSQNKQEILRAIVNALSTY